MKGFLSHISFDISEEILNNAHPEDFYTGQGKRYAAIGFVFQLAYGKCPIYSPYTYCSPPLTLVGKL